MVRSSRARRVRSARFPALTGASLNRLIASRQSVIARVKTCRTVQTQQIRFQLRIASL